MSPSPAFRVYLAGPISLCNDAQMSHWRDEVKGRYGKKMTFLDPVDHLVDPGASPYAFVEADLQHIKDADGLLVNMWRESIGTAMGVVHAHRHDRVIVVCDPNHLDNKMLAFFADAVEDNPLKGAKALWNLLRAERSWRVVKARRRSDEPFRREKIMEAVRMACRAANRDDIVIPKLVLPRVIEQLRGADRGVKKTVTTTDIDRAVADALDRLQGDAVHAHSVAGVLDAWQRRGRVSAPSPGRPGDPGAGAPPLENQVPVSCGPKSHATIWGKTVKRLEDIPSPAARSVFRRIASVPGITRIMLGKFGHKGRRQQCQASVHASKTRYVIDGKLYDPGPKGTMQSFQVWVQSDARKLDVTAEIERVLRAAGAWTE